MAASAVLILRCWSGSWGAAPWRSPILEERPQGIRMACQAQPDRDLSEACGARRALGRAGYDRGLMQALTCEGMKCRAEQRGEDWVLNGSKHLYLRR